MNFRNDLRRDLGKARQAVNDAKTGMNNAKTELGNAINKISNALASHKPNSAVITYEVGGYEFIENSPAWKQKCMVLPCSSQDWWAGYETKAIENVALTVPGQAQPVSVIIQLWKGWCQRLGGRIANSFPGGIGAEVGIYYKIPPSEASNWFSGQYWLYGPTSVGNFAVSSGRNDVKQLVQKNSAMGQFVGGLPRQQSPTDPSSEVWYPIPRTWWPRLSLKLVNPATGEEFTSTTTQTTYWLTRWMDPTDYFTKYQKCHATPRYPAGYVLQYTVNGKPFPAW